MQYQAYDYLARSGQLVYENLSVLNDLVSTPLNPLAKTPLNRVMSAYLQTSMRLTQRYDKPNFGISEVKVDGITRKVNQEVVLTKPFCDLVHFHKQGVTSRSKVLLVAPLSGHHATLLKGTVAELLPTTEIYITDWRDARDVPVNDGPFTFDSYVSYLIDFLNYLDSGDTHVIAICQPAVQAIIATAVMANEQSPNTPRSLTLMAGPIDVSKNPTRVNDFSQKRPMSWFRNVAIMKVPFGYPGEGRSVYPGFMQLGGFISMNLKSHYDKYVEFFGNLLSGDEEDAERFRAFYDEYLAVLDMPAEFYLETIERVFKNNEVASGTITYMGEPVDFGAIKSTALLTVEGANDDICGLGQTEAAQDLCVNIPTEIKKHHVQPNAGHYGIFSGSQYRKHIRPLISEFIATHRDK